MAPHRLGQLLLPTPGRRHRRFKAPEAPRWSRAEPGLPWPAPPALRQRPRRPQVPGGARRPVAPSPRRPRGVTGRGSLRRSGRRAGPCPSRRHLPSRQCCCAGGCRSEETPSSQPPAARVAGERSAVAQNRLRLAAGTAGSDRTRSDQPSGAITARFLCLLRGACVGVYGTEVARGKGRLRPT